MHNTYFHIMHSTLPYGHSFDSNWQIYDSFNRKHKRLLDTYQEIRPDNFSFDTLCKKHIMLPLNCIRIHSLIITVFQQMFYMIITANICILKWSLSSFWLLISVSLWEHTCHQGCPPYKDFFVQSQRKKLPTQMFMI